jgi:hypothetical protein
MSWCAWSFLSNEEVCSEPSKFEEVLLVVRPFGEANAAIMRGAVGEKTGAAAVPRAAKAAIEAGLKPLG